MQTKYKVGRRFQVKDGGYDFVYEVTELDNDVAVLNVKGIIIESNCELHKVGSKMWFQLGSAKDEWSKICHGYQSPLWKVLNGETYE